MYGKIFEQIYESSVCEDWKALVVFQQMIVLSDSDGTIDITPEAISRRTNIPIDIILYGIQILELPDPKSRTKDFDGKRIIRLDEHRDWGWFVVNKDKYCKMSDVGKLKELNKLRQQKYRDKHKQFKNGDLCTYCDSLAESVDHVIPKTKGGTVVVPSCLKCNQSKNSRDLHVFLNEASWLNHQKIRSNNIIMSFVTFDMSYKKVTLRNVTVTQSNGIKIEDVDKDLLTTLSSKPDVVGSSSKVSYTALLPLVFNFWREVHNHGKAILDGKRKKAIEGRLKEGYTLDRIKQAIVGIKESPYHMGQNDRNTKYDDIELICRSGTNVDRFADLVVEKQEYKPMFGDLKDYV